MKSVLVCEQSTDSPDCNRVKAIALSSPAVRRTVRVEERRWEAKDLIVLWWMRFRVRKARGRGSGLTRVSASIGVDWNAEGLGSGQNAICPSVPAVRRSEVLRRVACVRQDVR